VVIATLSVAMGRNTGQSVRLSILLAAWFGAVAMLALSQMLAPSGASVLRPLGLGLTVLVPVVAFGAVLIGSPSWQTALLSMPLAALIGVNTLRMLGAFFLILHGAGRLPAPFAPTAGWGDILVGASAPFIVWLARSKAPASRVPILLWNAFGLADLIVAVSLGATSAPGPLRIFHGEPGTALMTQLPWLLVPGFLVPLFLLTHLAVFYRFAHHARSARLAMNA
jgi:hypothetical protein